MVFVSRAHSLWNNEGRASKRYGNLIKSDDTVLNQMMQTHEDEVTAWIQEKIELNDAAEEEEEEEDDATESDDQSAAGGRVGVGVAVGESDPDKTVSDPDNTLSDPALSLGAEPTTFASPSRQILVPIVPPVDVATRDATAATAPSEVGDVFMSQEQ